GCFTRTLYRHRFSPCACDGNTFSYSFYQWKTGFIARTLKMKKPSVLANPFLLKVAGFEAPSTGWF
ncbi:MAG: hypothetical protein ACP5I8_15185, partial [Phycisphaerae bacterium]